MPSYKYRVLLDNGKIARGKILALNKSHAIQSLKNEDVQPIAIKRMKENTKKYRRPDYSRIKKNLVKSNKRKAKTKVNVDFKKLKFRDLKEIEIHPFKRVSQKDIISFVNNFYILKKSNFNNIQALEALIDATENPVFRDIVEDILIEVQSGERLYKAMEAYPNVFPVVFRNFIRVGEQAGNLDVALLYARDYVESSMELSKKIKKAIIPRVLQFFGIMALMMIAVVIGVPILESVYDMFNSSQEIPKATLMMLDFTKWFAANWYIIVLAILAIGLVCFIYYATPRGKYNVDKFLIKCPVLGDLNRNIITNKFFKAMLLNLRNGMRIQESLDISKNVTNNYYYLSAIETAKANALAGRSWLEPFEDMQIFKAMVIQMVGIGMKTDLSEMMEKVNVYIEEEVNESVARFVKVLPEITYLLVGIPLILFMITIVVPVVNVYMGGFIDIPT